MTGAVDRRSPVALDLRPLLAPRSVAVVGASERPPGTIVLENLKRLGFDGPVYPVNPKHSELQGLPCYPSMRDVGEVDCVAILLPAHRVMGALREAADAGARSAWVLAAGFAEAGDEGRHLQAELAVFAGERGMPICGPNCVGIVNAHAGVATYSVALPKSVVPGPIGAVVQSGAVCLGLANANRGIGFSTLISSGNEAVADNADYIAYLADDPDTRVIIAFVEGFRRPERFVWAADRARACGKPLLVVKVGRSAVARRAVVAHTGSLAGADAVHDAVMRKHGVVRLDSLDELLEAAELFSKAPLPRGRGIAILTLSGGQIGMVGDIAADMALRLPDLGEATVDALRGILPPYSSIANPLDAWGGGDFESTYPKCMGILARDPAVELIAVSRDNPPGMASREVHQSAVIVEEAARVADGTGKPVVVFGNISTGIEPEVQRLASDLGLPVLQGTRESLRAIEAFVDYATREAANSSETVSEPGISSGRSPEAEALLRASGPVLDESTSRQLLAACGIRGPAEALATSAGECVAAAERLGYPVVLKVSSRDVPHKTEAGGVLVGLANAEQVSVGYDAIVRRVSAAVPNAHIDGVLVQQMIGQDAVEVILGTFDDPEFGPMVVFGLGGVLVELIKDSTLRPAPVSRADALEMVEGIRGAALLHGFRGRPEADVDALADAIVSLSHFAADFRGEISAVDVNPLMVLPRRRGVVAVDALVVKQSFVGKELERELMR